MVANACIFILLGIVALTAHVFIPLIFERQGNPPNRYVKLFGLGIALLCFVIAACILFVLPQYHVWQQNKVGEAELAHAEQNRQIAIQEAKAKEESAKSLANAEIIRAEGIAKANKIIGDSLQNNDAYIHYLWIESLKESRNEVIYIPTEAGIPITEAKRFKNGGNNE